MSKDRSRRQSALKGEPTLDDLIERDKARLGAGGRNEDRPPSRKTLARVQKAYERREREREELKERGAAAINEATQELLEAVQAFTNDLPLLYDFDRGCWTPSSWRTMNERYWPVHKRSRHLKHVLLAVHDTRGAGPGLIWAAQERVERDIVLPLRHRGDRHESDRTVELTHGEVPSSVLNDARQCEVLLQKALPDEPQPQTAVPPASTGSHEELPEVIDNGGGLSKESLAIAALVDHPDWTDEQIATAAGCNRTSLYRWPKFKEARALLQQGSSPPQGTKNGETGDMEAWDS